MKSLNIDELKEHISEAIEQVQAGETIEVTNHGEALMPSMSQLLND